MDFSSVDKMPVFMAATPDFVDKNPDAVVAYLKAWLEVARDFKDNPNKVADVIYSFFTSKGYTMSQDTFAKALARVEVDPGFPSDLAALHAEAGRGAAAGEEDLRHPGLEEGAAAGLHGRRPAPERGGAMTGRRRMPACVLGPPLAVETR